MHEYSADVLDLMASAYDQACEKLLRLGGEVTRDIEFARSTLIDGIIEAVNRGVRSEDMLIAAALANLGGGADQSSRLAGGAVRSGRLVDKIARRTPGL